jgi:hypothetical protein
MIFFVIRVIANIFIVSLLAWVAVALFKSANQKRTPFSHLEMWLFISLLAEAAFSVLVVVTDVHSLRGFEAERVLTVSKILLKALSLNYASLFVLKLRSAESTTFRIEKTLLALLITLSSISVYVLVCVSTFLPSVFSVYFQFSKVVVTLYVVLYVVYASVAFLITLWKTRVEKRTSLVRSTSALSIVFFTQVICQAIISIAGITPASHGSPVVLFIVYYMFFVLSSALFYWLVTKHLSTNDRRRA